MSQILHCFFLPPPFLFTYDLFYHLMSSTHSAKPGECDLDNLNELSEYGTGSTFLEGKKRSF